MSGLIKNLFLLFGSSFLLHSNFIIEILRNRLLDNIRDFISWDSVRLHAHNPVIERQLSFLLLNDFIKLLYRFFIGVQPSVVFDLDDFIETLVLWELSINTF
jgi:hypothetical protein